MSDDRSIVALCMFVLAGFMMVMLGAGCNGETLTNCDVCIPGAKGCMSNQQVTCGDFNRDGCAEWGQPVACPSGQSCYNGICGSQCQNECSQAGGRRCNSSKRGYEVCSANNDADFCLEWGSAIACASNERCENGFCTFSCSQDCSVGERRCAGTGYQVCGEYDNDPCRDWSPVTSCKQSETCSNGLCSTACTNECEQQGREVCSGFQSYQQCGYFDHDSCLDLGPPKKCNLWERCLEEGNNADCVIMCLNECSHAGARQCVGDGFEECGHFDWDACLEWSNVNACGPGEMCSAGQCSSAPCENDCATEGLRECYLEDVGFRVCGLFDSDPCLDWATTLCGAEKRCVAGECQDVCQNECTDGDGGCLGETSQWVCTDTNGDGCYEKVTTNCPVDYKCSELVGICSPDCVDDRFEENDTAAAAKTLSASKNELQLCPGDDDWYLIHVDEDQGMRITITFDNNEGDLDMELYDPVDKENPIDWSESVSNLESIVVRPDQSEDFLVRVYGYDDSGNRYDVKLEFVDVNTCLDDYLEEFDLDHENDDQQYAVDLYYTYNPNLMLCLGDEDWYKTYAYSGDTMLVDTYFADSDGNIDVQVFDDSGTMLAEGVSDNDNEHVEAAITQNGDYFIRVHFGPGFNQEAWYDLEVGAGEPCFDDVHDTSGSNDTAAEAIQLPAGTYADLVICSDDEDWFKVPVPEGGSVLASITFADGDLDLLLGDAQQNAIDWSIEQGNSGTETVGAENLAEGEYYIVVVGYDGASSMYTLELVY